MKTKDIVHATEVLSVLTIATLALTSCSISYEQRNSVPPLPIAQSSEQACLNNSVSVPEKILPVKCEMEQIFGVPFTYAYGEVQASTPRLSNFKHWLISSPATQDKKFEVDNMIQSMLQYYAGTNPKKNCLTMTDVKNYVNYVGDPNEPQIKQSTIPEAPENCLISDPTNKTDDMIGFLRNDSRSERGSLLAKDVLAWEQLDSLFDFKETSPIVIYIGK